MASKDVISRTLSAITSIKLEETSTQQLNFENGKSKLAIDIANATNPTEKTRLLLDRVRGLASMGVIDDDTSISFANIEKFLKQAEHDPSFPETIQKDWQTRIEQKLDIHSLRYEYASLYGRIVKEWLSASDESVTKSTLGEVDRKEKYEQRATWEKTVFTPLRTNKAAIQDYLQTTFSSTLAVRKAWEAIRTATGKFEKTMECKELVQVTEGQPKNTVHFDEVSLKWVIAGLLRSDLLSDEKREVLKDFESNQVVLAEVADVLNMRMSSLDTWNWGNEGTPVEIRRQLNGRYRFYPDEDLLQTILLRYIGIKWSVHFKSALKDFQQAENVWKSSTKPLNHADEERRRFYLGESHDFGITVESLIEDHFHADIFLEQLPGTATEVRGAYDEEGDIHDTRKSPQDVTQSLLHHLVTQINIERHLGNDVTVVRSDFAWFGPSLPHSTMFTVLEHFGVSAKWIDFFRRALEAPVKFTQDGPDAPVQVRKRGTPISGPLSDMLGETILFCLDFAFNQRTGGALLYRLHDDIWFWGSEEDCVIGWTEMTKFAKVMGLSFNVEKTGCVKVAHMTGEKQDVSPSLPKGNVTWGFLKLDGESGRFVIDQEDVNKHIEELQTQLSACKSILDWIQAWNIYGARFFKTNFGRSAHCFGLAHVHSTLETLARIQQTLFATAGGSVTSALKKMLHEKFGVEDVPEGYLYFPMSMGGLDLKNPFVEVSLVRSGMTEDPDKFMRKFLEEEKHAYDTAKLAWENGKPLDEAYDRYDRYDPPISPSAATEYRKQGFMPLAEYTRHRARTSGRFGKMYSQLLDEPSNATVVRTSDTHSIREDEWCCMDAYQQWIIQLYAPDMIAKFGGLHVVERGLLPTGLVNMFRESRFEWRG